MARLSDIFAERSRPKRPNAKATKRAANRILEADRSKKPNGSGNGSTPVRTTAPNDSFEPLQGSPGVADGDFVDNLQPDIDDSEEPGESGSEGPGEAAPPPNTASVDALARMWVMAHDLLISRLTPDAPLSDMERRTLIATTREAAMFLPDDTLPPWVMAVTSLAAAEITICLPRYQTFKASTEKDVQGAPVPPNGENAAPRERVIDVD